MACSRTSVYSSEENGSGDIATASLDDLRQNHLEWTAKQGYILTGGGRAEEYFTPERGFPYVEEDLPHYHLGRKESHSIFSKWCQSKDPCSLITGVWDRPLFTGGWKHSTNEDETVFNIQTHNLFIDMRIPKTRSKALDCDKSTSSLDKLDSTQLRLYARQHVFAGFSVFSSENEKPFCTRHHCIDWNYIGSPRSRPNKWWIEMNGENNQWKEYSYATDDRGQNYYFERWERRAQATTPRLALRKSADHERDGIIVIVGDHFNYILARELTGKEKEYRGKSTLVDIVDAAVEGGDLSTAHAYLSIEAGHGVISKDWALDCAIPPWNEGKQLWRREELKVEGDSIANCHVLWQNEKWDVYDCSFGSLDELKKFLAP
jgi:hypothetical protein